MTGAFVPDPAADAAELARLDTQIPVLRDRAVQAHHAFVAADAAYQGAVRQRGLVAARLRVPRPVSTPPLVTAPAAAPAPAPAPTPAPTPAPARAPETSTRTVQNVLFILGGLLLGTAAIAFTAVAWATFGVVGRAVILAVVTLVALTIPLVALARRLRATAETFAAIGLLLVVLDGYAAWYVNLGHVQSLPGARYAGIVAMLTAVVGYGYRLATGLVGPSVIALIAAQPALVLLMDGTEPTVAAVSLVASATAGLNLFAVSRARATAKAGVASTAASTPGSTSESTPESTSVTSARASSRRMPVGAAFALQVLAWIFFLGWLSFAGLSALLAEASDGTVGALAWAGLSTVVAGGLLLAAALVLRQSVLVMLASAALVVAVAIALSVLGNQIWPNHLLLLLPGVALLLAAAAVAVDRLLPEDVRPGPRAGAVVVAGLIGVAMVTIALYAASFTLEAAYPLWHAPLAATGPHPPVRTWELPVALVVLAAALILSAPQWTRTGFAVGAGVLVVLAVPSAFSLAWWAPAVLSLAGAAVLVGFALVSRSTPDRLLAGFSGAVLVGDAVLASAARPWLTALVLAGVAVLGLAVVAARPSSAVDRGVVGFAALAGLLAVPPAVGSALVAAEVVPWWAARLTVGSVLLLVLVAAVSGRRAAWPPAPAEAPLPAPLASPGTGPDAVGSPVAGPDEGPDEGSDAAPAAEAPVDADPDRPGGSDAVGPDVVGEWNRPAVVAAAAFAATLASAVVWPWVAVNVGSEPVGVYAGISLLLIAAVLAVARPAGPVRTIASVGAGWAAMPGAVALTVVVLPSVLVVAAAPYEWLTAIWTGRPTGVGLAPDGTGAVHIADAVALALLAIACATAIYAVTRRLRPAVGGLGVGGPTAILVALTAWGAAWPAVPATTLLLGLVLVLAAALGGVSQWRAVVAVGQGIVYIGAGIAGSLGVEWATLAAVGTLIVAGAVIGAVGRTVTWRVTGLLVAVGAAVAEAAVAGAAADLTARNIAFWVLGVAVVVLFLGALLGRIDGRRAESAATQGAAHGAAVVALLFTIGWREHAALVCAVWGIAVGLRALLPGTSRNARATLAAVAAGFELVAWWLLLLNRGVTFVEAYTLPLAAVALLAGFAALRSRPDLGSWVAYGPALAAAFLPTLAVVIGTTGDPWRRLALGAGALAVVVAGSVARRRAPVVIGGLTLILVALHELVLLYQLLPGWVALAVGGVILVVLAVTYERRLRDLTRIRTNLQRMT